jgi:rhomboid protease GluP
MYNNAKKLRLTYWIIASYVIVYAYTSILGGNIIETSYDVLLQYGQFNLAVMNGAYWQLFTSIFVHVNIMHIAGNALFMLIFGLRAEDFFRTDEYLLIYFLSGLAGNILTLLIFGPYMVSAGASGAIFGMFGASAIYIRRTVGQSIISALMYAFFFLIISSGADVNNAAHLGGLVVGLLIGYALAMKRRRAIKYQYRFSYSTQA